MSNIETLKRAIEIAEQIDALQAELNQILGNLGGGKPQHAPAAVTIKAPRKGRKTAGSQRDQGTQPEGGEVPNPFRKKKRTLSAAGRARIVAALKKRWAKAGK